MKKIFYRGRRTAAAVPLVFGAVFFFLFLCFLISDGGLNLAGGYRGTAGRADLARAAAWDTSMSAITPGSAALRADGSSATQDYSFTVSSQAETACMYSISFTGVPEGIGVSLDGSPFLPGTDGTVSFSDASWRFSAGSDEPQAHSVRFTCFTPMDRGTDQIGARVHFTQID